ncbi:NAD(P)H-dependent oxidoreductase [Actinomycetospora atypica]|uniref:NAD(P)H-dependent oxidoreductase n=1 Tax=Actinomycetospora atypica TaxID=1290095 RepID=A0ABV9YPK4_9PSEU
MSAPALPRRRDVVVAAAVRTLLVVDAGPDRSATTASLPARMAGERIVGVAADLLRHDGPVHVEWLALREHVDHLATALVTGTSPALLVDVVERADAIVAVTPDSGGSGLLRTFLDTLEPGTLDGVPLLVAATTAGGGGVRAVRPLLTRLGAVVVPTVVVGAAGDPTAEAGVLAGARDLAAAVVAATPVPLPPRTDLDAADVGELWDRATHHGDLGEWSEAARMLERIVEHDPAATSVRLLLAQAYLGSAQRRRAEAQLRRVVATAPEDAYARWLLETTAA